MSNYRHIQTRRGTSAEWTTADPVLKEGEIGYDSTLNRMKVGDGTKKWSSLAWCTNDVINTLTSDSTTAALSAKQGKELKKLIDDVSKGGVTVVDNLTSDSPTSALSANMGRELNSRSLFGLGYEVKEWTSGTGKPSKIEFSDGVTCTLTWNGQKLMKITASTGEEMTINYNALGTITGRTITRNAV